MIKTDNCVIISSIELFGFALVSTHVIKTLLVLTVCLSFLGQALASTVMSYHMMNMKQTSQSSSQMNMMDHSHHQMTEQSTEHHENMDDSCCQQSCSCFSGSCSNIAAALFSTIQTRQLELSVKILSVSQAEQSQTLTSLYRPPIFA
ncbi:CopL family metal-binding regulatory protein [Thalassotalea sp. 1_MG-2023]|uniref:CopL family metal-binding regulatory protein n=1 Tax=Thalassotalea sp. 1_MG-2023 TaxID=3062680 RepID=UPI0026E36C31|nr:CopL family metal-binding regulatory protein [Thalassotalea sp. 1_MG-2023]MDO6427008.1 CopL family metal-binding regulatory protein [Thalassotalea sp. 1_MG-2023]